jgi:hypothetical protein
MYPRALPLTLERLSPAALISTAFEQANRGNAIATTKLGKDYSVPSDQTNPVRGQQRTDFLRQNSKTFASQKLAQVQLVSF